jgi:cysteine desulfuration protein SufE
MRKLLIFAKKIEMSINEIQDAIVEEFSVFDDWMDRYQQLIEYGKELPPIDERKRTEQYLIQGCQSKVWLDAELRDGKVYFTADSDAIITKGIVSLLIKVLSGRTPDEILNTDLYFIDKIGLKENLSPTRSNGLVAMIKQMRMYALAFKSKTEGAG